MVKTSIAMTKRLKKEEEKEWILPSHPFAPLEVAYCMPPLSPIEFRLLEKKIDLLPHFKALSITS